MGILDRIIIGKSSVVQPRLGERVLLVPQAVAWLTNPHNQKQSAIGLEPEVVQANGLRARDGSYANARVPSMTSPSWEVFTSTLLRTGYGLMVVRDGKLQVGPSMWDSGD